MKTGGGLWGLTVNCLREFCLILTPKLHGEDSPSSEMLIKTDSGQIKIFNPEHG